MYDQESAAGNRSPADTEAWPGRTATTDRPHTTGNGQAGAMKEKVAEVADVAKHDAGRVAGEVRTQAGRVADDVRQKVGEQARTQQGRLADRLRETGDELRQMAGDRPDSPARAVVDQLADRSSRLADYLADRGPDGLLADVQRFARRRPAAFLASAAVAGFVVGRLGKSVMAANSSTSDTPARTREDAGYAGYGAPMPANGTPTATSTPMSTPPTGTTYAAGSAEPIGTAYTPVPGTAAPVAPTYAPGTAAPATPGTTAPAPTGEMPPYADGENPDYHVTGQAPVPGTDPRAGGDRS
jgi:hypothetical protein